MLSSLCVAFNVLHLIPEAQGSRSLLTANAGGSYQVFIQKPDGRLAIEVATDERCADLYRKARQRGVGTVLAFQGEYLQDLDIPLSECGVGQEATVDVVLRTIPVKMTAPEPEPSHPAPHTDPSRLSRSISALTREQKLIEVQAPIDGTFKSFVINLRRTVMGQMTDQQGDPDGTALTFWFYPYPYPGKFFQRDHDACKRALESWLVNYPNDLMPELKNEYGIATPVRMCLIEVLPVDSGL